MFLYFSLVIPIVSSVFLHYSLGSWLIPSGLAYFDDSLIKDNISVFIMSILCFFTPLINDDDYVIVTTMLIMSFLGFYEFYLGFSLCFDSLTFVTQYGRFWFKNYNSSHVLTINSRFKCCDFHRLGEFRTTLCDIKHSQSCVSAIHSALYPSIKSTGYILIGHFLCHMVSSFLLFNKYMYP